jgi:hypothetical protein
VVGQVGAALVGCAWLLWFICCSCSNSTWSITLFVLVCCVLVLLGIVCSLVAIEVKQSEASHCSSCCVCWWFSSSSTSWSIVCVQFKPTTLVFKCWTLWLRFEWNLGHFGFPTFSSFCAGNVEIRAEKLWKLFAFFSKFTFTFP